MKKIINSILLLAAAAGFTACDMDKESPDSIPFAKAFSDIGTIEALERGAYSRLRTAISPNCMFVADLQADYVHAVKGFSNTNGEIYKWTYTQEAQEVEDVWNTLYGGISQYNFIIDGIDKHLKFEPTTDERTTLNRIQGSAYLMRALSYSLLAERFCGDYNSATAQNAYTGVPLITRYDTGQKPERASLYEVYEKILNDIGQARSLLKNYNGAANSTTLTIDCVTALEARVLLQMDNYPEALKKANDLLIGNTTYSLVDSPEALQQMWTYDKSPETIFQFYASKTEVAYQWGTLMYIDYFNGTDPYQSLMQPDYIPTQTCLDQYAETDWRRTAYFTHCTTTAPGEDGRFMAAMLKEKSQVAQDMFLISKYPGNPDLRITSSWNYYNTYKVFRLAEIYLIAAEAAAQSGGDAATPLNELRKHRGLAELPTVTLADVQEERYREMLMEGTRLTDLKRWGLGMTRGKSQEGEVSIANNVNEWATFAMTLYSDIQKTKDDYMFVWPIPESEISVSPDLKAQQNPGWKR